MILQASNIRYRNIDMNILSSVSEKHICGSCSEKNGCQWKELKGYTVLTKRCVGYVPLTTPKEKKMLERRRILLSELEILHPSR